MRVATGFAVAVVVPVAILFYFQFRSLSDLGKSTTVVLRQLSQETADGVTKTIQDSLSSPRINVLSKIGRGRTEPLDLGVIETTFRAGLASEPFVEAFYVWSEETVQHRGEVLRFDRETPTFVVNPPEALQIQLWFASLSGQGRAIAVFQGSVNGRRKYFVAQLQFNFPSLERLTSFVAMSVDAEQLRKEFIPRLVAAKYGAVGDSAGFPVDITVLDEDDRVVYLTGPVSADRFVDERTFPLVFYEPNLTRFAAEREPIKTWRVRTDFGAAIADIVAARERPQYVMMAVLAGVMILGIAFVARAASRELRVARLLEVANLRTRIALDLHDDIGSNLTKISILSEVARQQYRVPGTTDETLSTIARISRESAEAMSDIVWAINPDRDRFLELVQRMRRFAEEMCVSKGLTLSFQSSAEDPTFRLGIDVRRDLFLIFKEALNNLSRHSHCARVDVDVASDGSVVSLRVRDDGVGFDPLRTTDGAGLVSMKRRAQLHGWTFEVRSEPGQGATIFVVVPMNDGAHASTPPEYVGSPTRKLA